MKPRTGPRMRRIAFTTGIAVVVAVVAFGALTAIGVGGGGEDPARPAAAAPVRTTPRHLTALQAYSAADAKRENGTGTGGPPQSDSPPVPPHAFAAPIAAYRRYAARTLRTMQGDVADLRGALRTGNRATARRRWQLAFADYLRLGAVYGAFGTLDTAIDGSPGGIPANERARRFTGLHRLEQGLWTDVAPASLVPVADRLATDVRRLRAKLPSIAIEPIDYATRAHEILEDVQRDYLSGADVPWSGAGPLAADAGLDATDRVIHTLRPLLKGMEALDPVQRGLADLHRTLDTVRAAHDDRWPRNDDLRPHERAKVNASLGAALEALQLVPGELETQPTPTIPRLPTS